MLQLVLGFWEYSGGATSELSSTWDNHRQGKFDAYSFGNVSYLGSRPVHEEWATYVVNRPPRIEL